MAAVHRPCERRTANGLGLEPLGAHPALIATFLGHLRDCGASAQTLRSRTAAIRFFHREAGLASPTDHRIVRDLSRALDAPTPAATSAALPSPPSGSPRLSSCRCRRRRSSPSPRSRDRAADVCFGAPAGCNRRAQPRTLDFGRPGFSIVSIRKSKIDQTGKGQFVAVPRIETGPCAVAALEAWLAIREQKKGALFVTFSPHGELRETRIEGRLVAEVVKRLFRDA